MTHINTLTFTAFRNYDHASVTGLDTGFIVLTGENGAGKTNCLEGISCLSPGRGLRGANVSECQSQKSSDPWAVSALIIDNDGDGQRLGVGRDPQKPDKKIIRYNGETVKSQSDLGDILRAVWLTPQMDGLFLQGASERRRFFDRLVSTFDPAHAGRMTRYEKATRERLSLLKTAQDSGKHANAQWLAALEKIMAETGVALAAARLDTLSSLQNSIETNATPQFPRALCTLDGVIEQSLPKKSALGVEDMFRDKLAYFRHADGVTGRTHFGIHRTDFSVNHSDKNVNAAQCSTGEQKALLASVIMAHAHMVRARFGAPPLLLFDEIAAHFDASKRDALFDSLAHLGGQIWLTGQDKNSFEKIRSKTILSITKNAIYPL